MRKDHLRNLHGQAKIEEVLIFNYLFINHTQNTDSGENRGVNKHNRHEQEFIYILNIFKNTTLFTP